MSDRVRNTLRADLLDCTHALFEHYEQPLTEADGNGPASWVAVIGFSGDEMRGSMGLAVDPKLIAKLHQTMLGTPGDRRSQCDLLGELANQCLGRLKSRLGQYAVVINITTPMVLRGIEIAVAGDSDTLHLAFDTDAGGVAVWLEADIADGLELIEVAEEEMTSGLAASEMFLF